jgi:hypothetical protein
MNLNIKVSTEKLCAPIEVLRLNVRAYRALKRANVRTVGHIIGYGEDRIRQVNNIGPLQLQHIYDTVAKYLGIPSETLQRLASAGNQILDFVSQPDEKSKYEIKKTLTNVVLNLDSEASEQDAAPLVYLSDTPNRPNLVQAIVPLIQALLNAIGYAREYEILKRRYGLQGSEIYTLQEIGDYYGITRERVRQIEERAIASIGQALTEVFEAKKWGVPKSIVEEAESLFLILRSKEAILTETEAIDIIEERYQCKLTSDDVAVVRFVLSLAGLQALPKVTSETLGVPLAPAWIVPGKLDKTTLYRVINSVHKVLQTSLIPVSTFDLMIQVNRRCKKKVDVAYIKYASKACCEIESLNNDTYQLKFECLPSLADKAYRILHEANTPMHIRDIWREMNHRQVKAGLPADVLFRSIQQQLVSDRRLVPIGHSGQWSLANWKDVTNETLLTLMEEFFHLKQASATANEVYDYVHSKREGVRRSSILTYLYGQGSLFTRVSEKEYALAAWGMKPYKVPGKLGTENSEESIETELKAIFTENNTLLLPLSELVHELAKRTERANTTIYARLSKSPLIKLEAADPSHPRKKTARYLGENQQKPVNAKPTIRETIQREIENYLKRQPETKAVVTQLASFIMKKTGCKKPTFYSYLSEMESVRKAYENKKLVCFLNIESSSASSLEFPQIEAVTDEELKGNLRRAVRSLTIDNVDLGLFQLGKIFENELKGYLLEVKARGAFPVSNKDLERLTSMIDCLERNHVTTKKHHLTLLREQRNERAHGDMPDLAERQRLMQYAPFLGDLYIQYTVLLNKKRQELQKSASET